MHIVYNKHDKMPEEMNEKMNEKKEPVNARVSASLQMIISKLFLFTKIIAHKKGENPFAYLN